MPFVFVVDVVYPLCSLSYTTERETAREAAWGGGIACEGRSKVANDDRSVQPLKESGVVGTPVEEEEEREQLFKIPRIMKEPGNQETSHTCVLFSPLDPHRRSKDYSSTAVRRRCRLRTHQYVTTFSQMRRMLRDLSCVLGLPNAGRTRTARRKLDSSKKTVPKNVLSVCPSVCLWHAGYISDTRALSRQAVRSFVLFCVLGVPVRAAGAAQKPSGKTHAIRGCAPCAAL